MSVKIWQDHWFKEEEERHSIDVNSICNFGVKVLDDVLIGILKKDLIVIGADSGVGKSELCLKIAINNAMKGKKVALYFLEGGSTEAIARIKWQLICDKYFTNKMSGLDMNYRKWRMNMIKEPLMDKLEEECHDYFESKVKNNLMMYDSPNGLTLKDFTDSLDYFLQPEEGFEDDPFSYKHKCDLIIIDHLQYFSLTNPKNELIEQAQILQKVNQICHNYKIPVILASHLRKKDKDRGLPSQEDFYGTSNIPKMSSISITMSSEATADGINYPTYFRFVKSRTRIPSCYAIRNNFNLTKGKYDDEYSVYQLFGDTLPDNPLTQDKLPKFVQGAKGYIPVKGDKQWTD